MIRIVIVLGMLGSSAPALAAAAGDWPCIQRKVPELSLAAVWTGPDPGDTARNLGGDKAAADLVGRIAQRRTSLEEARALVAEFHKVHGPKALIGAFAGLFDKLNAERKDVIAGIERYGRKQKALADRIRLAQEELPKWKQDSSGRYEELEEQIAWDLRIFDERQKALSAVCEVPQIVERRLFDLGKTMAALIAAN